MRDSWTASRSSCRANRGTAAGRPAARRRSGSGPDRRRGRPRLCDASRRSRAARIRVVAAVTSRMTTSCPVGGGGRAAEPTGRHAGLHQDGARLSALTTVLDRGPEREGKDGVQRWGRRGWRGGRSRRSRRRPRVGVDEEHPFVHCRQGKGHGPSRPRAHRAVARARSPRRRGPALPRCAPTRGAAPAGEQRATAATTATTTGRAPRAECRRRCTSFMRCSGMIHRLPRLTIHPRSSPERGGAGFILRSSSCREGASSTPLA